MVKNDLDMSLGQKLRMLRKVRRLTQKELAKKIGISFQQLQKNEKGDNQISCSRLSKLAKVLNVDVSYFFIDYENTQPEDKTSLLQEETREYESFLKPVISDEGLKLLGAYESIKNTKLKRMIKEFVDILAKSQSAKKIDLHNEH